MDDLRVEGRNAAPAFVRRSVIGLIGLLLSCAAACVQTTPEEPARLARGAAPAAVHAMDAEAEAESTRASAARAGLDAGGGEPGLATTTATRASTRIGVMTWNLEWFQDPNEGPIDDAAQYAGVRAILAGSDAGVIALQEVASEAAFERLLADLPARSGILSGYAATQKTALLWDAAVFELVSARALSGLDDAGRPPLEVALRSRFNDRVLLVVVIHAKAQADALSRGTRERLAQGVKAHLDTNHGDAAAIVLGDFNDSLIGSIVDGADSPYRAFAADPAHYATPTLRLDRADAGESSYASHGATIDHIIVSDELVAAVDPASVGVLRDELLRRYPNFADTVSDHFPVTLSLLW
jgi:endonuclease/exonuclease/phosphatase family metal-dependent hydrolase